jgi:ABC-type sugar transport system ATPase subunit
MTTIRVQDVSKNYDAEPADPTRAFGAVIGYAGNIASRPLANDYRHDLQNAGKPPEPKRPQALLHVNLEIRSGETMGILGPSGCGKTTLLKVIAGLISPDSGTVLYDGEDMATVAPGERGIGIVFQDYALYPHMVAQQNIGFFFQLHKRKEEIPDRVKQVSEIMGIGFEALLARKPPTLSGGERQRVAVARCIARDPRLFLFDEPLSNLDAQLRTKTRIELKRLLTRFRVTGVYVTHDQVEAIALCDRLAIMRDGHVEQVGSYQRLIDQPVNTFVAGFVGIPPMNLFNGYWTETGWKGSSFEWPLPETMRQMIGSKGTLGVRPQHVRIGTDLPLVGRVSLVEPLLSERVLLVYLDIGANPTLTCVSRLSQDDPAAKIQLGDVVNLGFDADSLVLFDGVSTKRITG